jgi:tyrosyl-tRNA synthetase
MSEVLKQLLAGTVRVLPEGGLEKKLTLNRPLRVKLGADPTAPDLHLGHAVVLSKLRQFQDAGHHIQFLIGDFTAAIGDPTGKSATRPPLSRDAIVKNAETYLAQVSRVLDPSKLTVLFNSEWLSALSLSDFVRLAGKTTVARIIEREDFANRLKEGSSIGFHELLYPLFQGYDSVHLESDIELGGTDQTFNLLMGRALQEQYGQEAQVVMTLPLLEGLDGVQKMSKSLGNYVGLSETADTAYGKLLSISDELMWKYWLLLSGLSEDAVNQKRDAVAAGTVHPMTCKKDMARSIVARFWSADEAEQAQAQFEAVFQQKKYEEAPEVVLPEGTANPLWIVELLRLLGAVQSGSEARRLIASGAVSVDQVKITDGRAELAWKPGMTVRVGKHRIYVLA